MVQYHLNILVATGLLTSYSDGKMRRFFETSKYSSIQMKIMSLLRHKTRGQILEIVTENKTATHSDLANQLSRGVHNFKSV
jgi:predicted transcriptional regulator